MASTQLPQKFFILSVSNFLPAHSCLKPEIRLTGQRECHRLYI